MAMGQTRPFFAMPVVLPAAPASIPFYCLLGGLIGVVALGVNWWVYAVEDGFEEHLPMPWWSWPAIGGIAVGVMGYFSPLTLGVGYDNIERALSGGWVGGAALLFCVFKFLSWSLCLGSGTSGGTLAPLMTVGGGLGAVLGNAAASAFPQLGIDPRLAALVGMAGLFAGCSRTFLASVIFAFETTGQPAGLMPVFCGCAVAYLVSCRARNSIMTEKIVRRGVKVPMEYSADHLALIHVGEIISGEVRTLTSTMTLAQVRAE